MNIPAEIIQRLTARFGGFLREKTRSKAPVLYKNTHSKADRTKRAFVKVNVTPP